MIDAFGPAADLSKRKMRIAFIIYDGMTALDFVGVYDAVTRLKTMRFVADVEWDVCATAPEVTDFSGLRIAASRTGGSLGEYDWVRISPLQSAPPSCS